MAWGKLGSPVLVNPGAILDDFIGHTHYAAKSTVNVKGYTFFDKDPINILEVRIHVHH